MISTNLGLKLRKKDFILSSGRNKKYKIELSKNINEIYIIKKSSLIGTPINPRKKIINELKKKPQNNENEK